MDDNTSYIITTFVLVGLFLYLLKYLDDHKHKWTLKDYHVIPSRLEVMKRNGFNPDHVSYTDTAQSHVIVYTCEGCGKMKVIKKSNG